LPNSRETPAVDETKIIAAILCARTLLPEDVASDPVGKIVDLYERIASADPRPRSEAAEAGAVRVRVKVAGRRPRRTRPAPTGSATVAKTIGRISSSGRCSAGRSTPEKRRTRSRRERDSNCQSPRERDYAFRYRPVLPPRRKLVSLIAWQPSAANKYPLATSAAHHEPVVISKLANEIVRAEAKAA
jgi:hypothetical protein